MVFQCPNCKTWLKFIPAQVQPMVYCPEEKTKWLTCPVCGSPALQVPCNTYGHLVKAPSEEIPAEEPVAGQVIQCPNCKTWLKFVPSPGIRPLYACLTNKWLTCPVCGANVVQVPCHVHGYFVRAAPGEIPINGPPINGPVKITYNWPVIAGLGVAAVLVLILLLRR